MNKWKNIGIWLLWITVGINVFSAGVIRYKVLVEDLKKNDPSFDKWIIMSLVFGGMSITLQAIACLIMISATRTTVNLTKKNDFDRDNFKDIMRNRLVCIFICVGYAIDYTVDLVMTSLVLQGKINY